ncbi:MAG: TonB-dependent receptor [Steroidobacteraceae bacterium]
MRIKKRGWVGRSAGLLAMCGALIAAGAAFSQSATAQSSTDEATTAQAGADATVLQEVVVTAERRTTDIMTTPISVVAVSGAQLQTSQIVDVNSLGQVAPNLLVYNEGLSSTADIRGVGNSNQGGDETPGVAMVRDGLPNNTSGFGENIPYFDIADVEVLRGPQGTFTGSNSTGGAIDINSANPNFRGLNGFLDATVATYSEQRLTGAVNLPVNDTLALRLAFNEETRGSFFRDEQSLVDGPFEGGPSIAAEGNTPSSGDQATYDPGNVDDKDIRVGVLWKPTDNFQSLTKIEFDNDDSDGIPTQPNLFTFTALKGQPCPRGDGTAPNCHSNYFPGYSGSPYVRNDWASSITKANAESAEYLEEARYTLSDGIVLRALGGVQELNQTQVSSTSHDTINPGDFTQSINHTPIYSGEFDAISPTTGPLSWIAGAMISYTNWSPNEYARTVTPPFSASAPEVVSWVDGEAVRTETHGVFAQVSWQFTPTLQLVAGGRMSWDSLFGECPGTPATCGNKHLLGIYAPGIGLNIELPPGLSTSDRVPSGKLDLNWTPLPGQYFYGFIARGYKPGESNIGYSSAAHYEWVNDYELGYKSKLAGGHVSLQLDGYYMQYHDMIHSVFNPEIPSNTNEVNIPISFLKGIEASLVANVGHLSVNLNGSYNKSILGPVTTAATYKFPSNTLFGTTPQCAPGVAPNNLATGCSDYTGSYPGDTSYIVTLGGESLPYAPPWTGSGTIQYTIPVGDMTVVPRVQYSYRSKAYTDIFEDAYHQLPGYSLWSAYLDWNAGPWTTTIYGTNLANSIYLEGAGLYGDPRQLGLELRRTF